MTCFIKPYTHTTAPLCLTRGFTFGVEITEVKQFRLQYKKAEYSSPA